MNRFVRSVTRLTSLASLGAIAAACSAAPGGEAEMQTSQGISYPPFPPATVSALGAADLENGYSIPTYINPGTTIAILTPAGDDPNADEDLSVYRSAYGLPGCSQASGCLKVVTETGATTGLPVATVDGLEGITPAGIWVSTALDMASAGCPSCKLLVVELTGDNPSDLYTAVNTAKGLGASAMVSLANYSSIAETVPTTDPALSQPGITVFASASATSYEPGVAGAGEFVTDYPASSPNVISVGLTNLTFGVTPTSITSDSASALGWPLCSSRPKPSWQKDTACSGRTVNDVSATGGPVWTFNTFKPNSAWALSFSGWVVQGGTGSDTGWIVAPSLVAGIFAQTGNGGAGPSYPYANPILFNDVTTGSVVQDGTTCAGILCNAAPGYDAPTGVGTPNGLEMALVNQDVLNLDFGTIEPTDPYLADQGTRKIVLWPGLSTASMIVETDTSWASGCATTFGYSGLPQGVTATSDYAVPNPTEPYGMYHLTAAANSTLGQQTTMTISATACGITHYVQAEVSVQACVPTAMTCPATAQCGAVSNGCGGTLDCGAGCGAGEVCSDMMCCPTGTSWNGARCEAPVIKPKCTTPAQCCTQAGGDWRNGICQ